MSRAHPERRRRWPTNLRVLLIIDPGGASISTPASGFDFSHYGIGVRCHIPLVGGQIVDVIPNEGPTHAVRGRVVWVKSQQAGQGCEAGLEFLKPSLERSSLQPGEGPS